MGPAAAWAVPAAISAVSALYAAHKQNNAEQQQKDALKKQQALQNDTIGYAKGYSEMGRAPMQQGMNFFQNLVGTRSGVDQAIGPELNSIAGRYRNSYNTARALTPRGSGVQMDPFAAQRDQTNLMFNARRDAAGNLFNMGSQLTGLGLNAQGLGANIGNANFGNMLAGNQQNFNIGQALGNTFMQAYQGYLANRNANATTSTPSSYGLGGTTNSNLTSSNWMNMRPASGNAYANTWGTLGTSKPVTGGAGTSSGFYTPSGSPGH